MKVYVDELPNGCDKCPFNHMTFFWTSNVFEKCKATNECQLGFAGKCEIQSLADYTKQVKKEVCEIVKKAINECRREYYEEFLMHSNPIREKYYRGYDFIRARTLEALLDQIQGETECQKN